MKIIRNKKEKQSVKPLKGTELILAPAGRTKKSLPLLSKAQLHNYFADKMAIFSTIIGYISDNAQRTHYPKLFKHLHKKLRKIQREFLIKYHELAHEKEPGMSDGKSKIRMLFEQLYRFEKTVVAELIDAGIKPQELMDYRAKYLLSAAK